MNISLHSLDVIILLTVTTVNMPVNAFPSRPCAPARPRPWPRLPSFPGESRIVRPSRQQPDRYEDTHLGHPRISTALSKNEKGETGGWTGNFGCS